LKPFPFFGRKDPGSYSELDAVLWDDVRSGRPALSSLDDTDASALRRLASWFIATKSFVPTGDVVPDEMDKAVIALLACLPILRLGARWYDDWSTILVAPDSFIHPMSDVDTRASSASTTTNCPAVSPNWDRCCCRSPTCTPPVWATATTSSCTRWRTSSTNATDRSTAARRCRAG
jgi:hypothetical protein